MIINNSKVYYAFRFISWVVIPVLAVLWYIISGIIHTSTPSPVVGVVIAIDAYLGITLQISSVRHNKQKQAGYLVRSDSEEKRTYSLELEMDPEEFQHEDELVFKMRAL